MRRTRTRLICDCSYRIGDLTANGAAEGRCCVVHGLLYRKSRYSTAECRELVESRARTTQRLRWAPSARSGAVIGKSARDERQCTLIPFRGVRTSASSEPTRKLRAVSGTSIRQRQNDAVHRAIFLSSSFAQVSFGSARTGTKIVDGQRSRSTGPIITQMIHEGPRRFVNFAVTKQFVAQRRLVDAPPRHSFGPSTRARVAATGDCSTEERVECPTGSNTA